MAVRYFLHLIPTFCIGLSRSTDVRIDESHTLAVLNPDTHAVITVK